MEMAGAAWTTVAEIVLRDVIAERVEVRLAGDALGGPHPHCSLHAAFVVGGTVPEHAIQRAIDLSREKYCSVWHSLRAGHQARHRIRGRAESWTRRALEGSHGRS